MAREVTALRIAMIGGDRRAVLLAKRLAEDGNRVRSFALEKAESVPRVYRAGCLQGCVYGAEIVVLPIPAERGGVLNAPYSDARIPISDVMAALWQGQIVCGGALGREVHAMALQNSLTEIDLTERESFALANAFLTAEGAAECLTSLSDRAIWGSSALVVGWGRVGKAAARTLSAMGAAVAVAARKASDRAEAAMCGCAAVETGAISAVIDGFDFIVNTVPARVITNAALERVPEGSVVLELASAPGGFDRAYAEKLGVRAASAPGLPGRYAPRSAAELMAEEIYAIASELETGE